MMKFEQLRNILVKIIPFLDEEKACISINQVFTRKELAAIFALNERNSHSQISIDMIFASTDAKITSIYHR